MNARALKFNPAILLNGNKTNSNSLATKGTDRGFSSIIKGLINALQDKAVATENPRSSSSLKVSAHQHIESLKRALAAQGIALKEASLDSEHFHLLRTFLEQCGLSINQAEGLIKETAQNNPGGTINLEAFLQRLSDSELLDEQPARPVIVESSLFIPKIEPQLRDCGLSQKHIDHALAFATLEDGKIDLTRLIAGLKKQTNTTADTVNRVKLNEVIASIQEAAHQSASPQGAESKGVSEKIAAMVAMIVNRTDYGDNKKPAATTHETYSSPPRVSDTSDHITAITNAVREKGKPLSFPSKGPELDSSLSPKEKGAEMKHGDKAHHIRVSASDTHSTSANYHSETSKEFNAKGQTGRPAIIPESDHKTGLKENFKNSARAENLDMKPVPIQNNGGTSVSSQQNSSPGDAQNMEKNNLPAYVVNQVGRQIGKSLRNGKGFIKLQLKPPELGTLKIRLGIEDNGLTLKMIAQDSTVKHILLSHLHELKENLLSQGIKPEEIDIQIDYKADQSLSNPDKQPRNHGEGERLPAYTAMTPSISDEIKVEETDTEPYNRLSENHILNLTV